MNYQAHYDRLIFRARHRRVKGYKERHHVVPRCMGGTDDKRNIVVLTPEEHFVAHQLLVKIYFNHPGIAFAAFWMSRDKKRNQTNKTYGWLRRKFAKQIGAVTSAFHKGRKRAPHEIVAVKAGFAAMSIEAKQLRNARASASLKGKKRTPETKALMSEVALHRPPVSEETCKKISSSLKGHIPWNKGLTGVTVAWNKGMKMSVEHCEKLSEAHKGFVPSKESNEKRSATMKGRVFTEEHKANISKGKKNCSPETCALISANRRKQAPPTLGKTFSLESRERMSIAQRKRFGTLEASI